MSAAEKAQPLLRPPKEDEMHSASASVVDSGFHFCGKGITDQKGHNSLIRTIRKVFIRKLNKEFGADFVPSKNVINEYLSIAIANYYVISRQTSGASTEEEKERAHEHFDRWKSETLAILEEPQSWFSKLFKRRSI